MVVALMTMKLPACFLPSFLPDSIQVPLFLLGWAFSSRWASLIFMTHRKDPALQADLVAEQARVLGQNPEPLSIASIDKMTHLWASVRETLRLRPPLLTLMRL